MQVLKPHCFATKIPDTKNDYGIYLSMTIPNGLGIDYERISQDTVYYTKTISQGKESKQNKREKITMISIPIILDNYEIPNNSEYIHHFIRANNPQRMVLVRIYQVKNLRQLKGINDIYMHDDTIRIKFNIAPVKKGEVKAGRESGGPEWPPSFNKNNIINEVMLIVQY